MRLLLVTGFLGPALFAQAQPTPKPDYDAAGKKAIEAHNYPEAVAAFRQAVSADPADFVAHFNLGYAYTLAGNDSAAVDEFKKVLELKPGVFEPQLNLGVTLLRLGRFPEA